jgi:hypothetical protein
MVNRNLEPLAMHRYKPVALVALLLIVSLPAPGWAGPITWSGGVPEGGPVRAVLIDPHNALIIYVGTLGSGVFKSTDGGASWTQSDPAGPLAARTVRALAVDGVGTTLFAGVEEDDAGAATGGVYVSFDFGGSWIPLGTGLTSKKVLTLAWDGATMWAGTREEQGVPGGVFKWNGSMWIPFNNGLAVPPPSQNPDPAACPESGQPCPRRVQALAFDSRFPGTAYAGTIGTGVFKTVNGGQSWTQISNQGFRSDCLENPEILALAVDVNIPTETVYAGATGDAGNLSTAACNNTPANGGHQGQGAGFFRFQSSEWDRRMRGDFETLLPTTVSAAVWTLATSPPNATPGNGCPNGCIYIGTDIGVLRSNDGSGSWKLVPASANPSNLLGLPVRALALDQSVTLYAGTSGRGIFKRPPQNDLPSVGIQPWSPINAGLTALRVQTAGVGSRGGTKTALAGIDGGGIITSSNGFSWQNTGETSLTIRAMAVDPMNPSIVYAATGKGVIKSLNGGDTFAQASAGLPTEQLVHPLHPKPGNPPITVRAIAVDPARPNVLYAGVAGIYKSIDGGMTWAAMNAGLDNPVITGDGGNGIVSAFAVDRNSPGVDPTWGTVYAATDGAGVYRSTDGGASWVQINGTAPTALSGQSVLSLALDPALGQSGAVVYAGTSTGRVFKRVVNAGGWTEVATFSLPGQPVNALAIKLGAPSQIFAGLVGGGVYSILSNASSWTPMNSGLASLNVSGLAYDPENAGTLYAATLGRGIFVGQPQQSNTPFLAISSPSANSTSVTTPVAVTGQTLGSLVFWSTSRGHAGLAIGVNPWTASVPLEPGPNRVTITAVDVSSNQSTQTISVTLPIPAEDLSGDGDADVLWRHSSGLLCIWLMNGANISTNLCPGSVGLDWSVQGFGDFDGDGRADVLWRHSSGTVCFWLMNGTNLVSNGCPGSVGLDWSVEGVGDLDGDGRADIIWRNTTSGAICIWLMNGTNLVSNGCLGNLGLDWSMHVGDFDGDGRADIVWQSSISGTVCIWLMNGTNVVGNSCPGSVGLDWSIQDAADFNGDGKTDLLWRNATTGIVCIWFMNGTSLTSSGCSGAVSTDWSIQYAADFNGDRRADILWRNATSGLVCIWFMNGASIASDGCPATAGNDWTIQ